MADTAGRLIAANLLCMSAGGRLTSTARSVVNRRIS